MQRQNATTRQSGKGFLSAVLVWLVLQSLTACGTLEIDIERTPPPDDAVDTTTAALGTGSTPDQATVAAPEERNAQTVTPATREVIPETAVFTPVPQNTAVTPTLAPTRFPRPAVSTSTPTLVPTPVLTTTSIPSHTNLVVQSLGILDTASRVRSVSADGRYLLFESTSADLVDRPMSPDIPRVYLYDWEADEITLVSTTPGGAPADHWSTDSVLSADGSTVAFWSFAGNLAGEGVQDCPDVEPGEPCGSLYIYDVDTRALERVPVGAGYGRLGAAHAAAVSGDGRYVAFATNWAAIWEGTMLLDRETGEIEQISTTGLAVDLSVDGRYVAFASDEGDLVPNDTNEAIDVFVPDRETGQIERISTPLEGEESDQPSGVVPLSEGYSGAIDLSPDGRYVLFTSGASNLVDAALAPCKLHPWEELPACQHVYLHDRETGVTELVSLSDNDEPGDGISSGGSVSADRRWVAFISHAGNLTPEGPIKSGGYRLSGNGPGVFVRDRQEGRTYLVSVALDGQLPNDASLTARITADGRYVVFLSFADNLVPGVEGGLFVADLHVLVGEE